MFFIKKEENKTTKKLDRIVTWLIIWWAVAWTIGFIGLSKTEKAKQIKEKIKTDWPSILKQTHDILWWVLVKALSLFDNKK